MLSCSRHTEPHFKTFMSSPDFETVEKSWTHRKAETKTILRKRGI